MTCPKCRGTMIGPRYRKIHTREELVYHCLCGWEEAHPTADAKPNPLVDLVKKIQP